jgi:hypothetical protein
LSQKLKIFQRHTLLYRRKKNKEKMRAQCSLLFYGCKLLFCTNCLKLLKIYFGKISFQPKAVWSLEFILVKFLTKSCSLVRT